ncbi:MAG: hypothetical protein ORN51_01260, partial [Akkermansiaceae bacterium]|nr:hypothetical protein [Akkermansiaceae bacterium]
MQATVYANLTTRRLTTTLGGSAISFPAFVQGDKVRIGMRFAESLEGSPIEVQRIVTHIRASIGFVDARPTSGFFVLNVDGQNTAPIQHDATAGAMQSALSAIGLDDAVVGKQDGSWIISTGMQEIALSGNSAIGLLSELRPVSFVRVRSKQVAGQYRHEVRLVQAPLASTASFETIVPPAPTVSEVQAGGSSATTLWPEIQALKIQPTFKGTYQLRRGFKKTRELSVDDGPDEIQDALSVLVDDEGSFSVSNPATNIAHITFNGSMAGIDQELIEVAVFSAPPGDPTIILDLNTAEIAAALRGAAELKPDLEIEVAIQDENDPTKTYTLTPFRAPISLIRELNWEGLETAANIDWLRPPYGRTYVPFTPDQIITGSQHYVAPIGDGVNDEFTISHNLGTRDLHVTVRQNGGDFSILAGGGLSPGSGDIQVSGTFSPPFSGTLGKISNTYYTSGTAYPQMNAEWDGGQWTLSLNFNDAYKAEWFSEEPVASPDLVETWTPSPYGDVIPTGSPTLSAIVSSSSVPTITLDSENDLTITFDAAPALNGYVVTISTAGPVSAFQVHGHTIPQIEGLQLILDDLGARVEDLETFIPTSLPSVSNTQQTVIAAWELPELFEVFPTRQKIEAKDVPSIKLADLPRVGGLLPAVHVDPLVFTTANVLPTSPTTGVVYQYTNTSAPLVIPGYLGRRSTKLNAPGFFAWDGRGFYQVEQLIAGEKVFYPSDFSRELFRIHVNGKQLRLGKQLSLDFSFVAAVFNSNTSVHWGVAIDIGLPSSNPTSPSNIADVTFLPPSLDHSFMLTSVPSSHGFGLRVVRKLVDAVDTCVVDRVIYGAMEATPTTMN